MTTSKGFRIEVSSRYEEWWRYNVELMCGCFDAAEQRTGFASPPRRLPTWGPIFRSVLRRSPRAHGGSRPGACDHLVLYVYIIPHTLPPGNDIDATAPFEIEIRIFCDGRRILAEKRRINQWSGA